MRLLFTPRNDARGGRAISQDLLSKKENQCSLTNTTRTTVRTLCTRTQTWLLALNHHSHTPVQKGIKMQRAKHWFVTLLLASAKPSHLGLPLSIHHPSDIHKHFNLVWPNVTYHDNVKQIHWQFTNNLHSHPITMRRHNPMHPGNHTPMPLHNPNPWTRHHRLHTNSSAINPQFH